MLVGHSLPARRSGPARSQPGRVVGAELPEFRDGHASRRRVSAVRNQYFKAIYGLKSKSCAFVEISLTDMGFETWNNPAMTAVVMAVRASVFQGGRCGDSDLSLSRQSTHR
jgi:hypothetical protein